MVIAHNGEVARLVQERQGIGIVCSVVRKYPVVGFQGLFGELPHIEVHGFQPPYQEGGGASGEPVVSDNPHRKSVQQTPGAIDVSESLRKVIAVVGLFQLGHDVIVGVVQVPATVEVVHFLRQQFDVRL